VKRGFTLIEIITVMGISCVMAAILFPVMGWAHNRAIHVACADNLRQLGVAEHLYANDHDGWVPPATTAADGYFTFFNANPMQVAASPGVLRNALDPYVRSQDVWFCPADPQARQDVIWLGMDHLLTSYWFYPVVDGAMGHLWPPRMQLMGNNSDAANGVPLICDAVGIPNRDSQSQFATGDDSSDTNHSDGRVNVIRADLSMERKTADFMVGLDH
jgi:prepilin-type N-terminal cleavage/methylation domain-containing protein